MLIELKPIILIGHSKQFSNKSLFEKKLTKILSHLEDYEVIAVGDEQNLIKNVFDTKVVNTIPYRAKTTIINKILEQSTYVVMFWDGTDIDEFVYRSLLYHKKSRIIPVETTKVVNKDKGEPFDVYIGRGTPWGNPFAIGVEGMTREDVIAKYEEYFKEKILGDEVRRKEILSLKGKILGCHCKPLACHGDVIASYINSLDI